MDSPTDALRRSLRRLRTVQRRLQEMEGRLPPRSKERVSVPLARGLERYEADLPPAASPSVAWFERRSQDPPPRWPGLRRLGQRLRGRRFAPESEADPADGSPAETPDPAGTPPERAQAPPRRRRR